MAHIPGASPTTATSWATAGATIGLEQWRRLWPSWTPTTLWPALKVASPPRCCGQSAQAGRPMPRKAQGDRPLTGAERQARQRTKAVERAALAQEAVQFVL